MEAAVTAATNQTSADMQWILDTAWQAYNNNPTLSFVITGTPAGQSAQE
jgi:hypothetical protein